MSVGIIFDYRWTLQNADLATESARYAALEYVRKTTDPNLDVGLLAHIIKDRSAELGGLNGPLRGEENKVKREETAFRYGLERLNVDMGLLDYEKMQGIFADTYLDKNFLWEDVRKNIPILSKLYPLALNTLCDPKISGKLKETKFIKKYFRDRITTPYDVDKENGHWKKDRKSMQHTINLFKDKPKNFVMVGDRLIDFPGANSIGITTVLIERHAITEIETNENKPKYYEVLFLKM